MTSKFNKNVLASAIAAAAFMAGAANAADLRYNAPTQITYAKDLFATDSRTIDLPAGFTVRAVNDTERTAAAAIAAGNDIEIVISLGQGANAPRFQSSAHTMSEAELRQTIMIGTQLNGAVQPLGTVDATATVTYSQGEREMRIRFKAANAGNGAALPSPIVGSAGYAFQLPALRVYDLQGALLENSAVHAGMSITNVSARQQVVAGNATLARSVWGEKVETVLAANNKWIDVQRCSAAEGSRVWFTPVYADAPTSVGQSCTYIPGREWFNAGQIDVSIVEAQHAGIGAGPTDKDRINDFDGATRWGLASTVIKYKVTGENLAGFNGVGGNNHMWLDTSANCARATNSYLDLKVNDAGTEATASHNMAAPVVLGTHFLPLTNSADPVSMHVCFSANGKTALVPQNLNAEVAFDHNVPALFVNPDVFSDDLFPLRTNAGILLFQNVNPANNMTAQSFLRLTNHNDVDCDVVIDAKDDAGLRSAEDIKLTLKPHSSEQLNIDILESGVDAKNRITGKFGDGTGKWYVRVQPECARFDGSALNRNASDGTVTDLTPQRNKSWLTPPTRLTK